MCQLSGGERVKSTCINMYKGDGGGGILFLEGSHPV